MGHTGNYTREEAIAAYLVYFALAAAALTFLVTRDVRSTISVIIVAGACGIAAGTPLAILGAIGQAARKGAIIKGGIYLEHLSSVDTVVLDKTGTLTHGKAEVIALHPVPGVMPEELLRVAASAERFSEHPLGKAIVQKAAALHISMDPPEDFVYLPGKGIHCWVKGCPRSRRITMLLGRKRRHHHADSIIGRIECRNLCRSWPSSSWELLRLQTSCALLQLLQCVA